jgi:hypothetical protein
VATHPGKLLYVANQHKYPSITARPETQLRRRFAAAAADTGITVNDLVISLMRFWLDEGEKPPGPPAVQARDRD